LESLSATLGRSIEELRMDAEGRRDLEAFRFIHVFDSARALRVLSDDLLSGTATLSAEKYDQITGWISRIYCNPHDRAGRVCSFLQALADQGLRRLGKTSELPSS
jgi:hypothetical protein